MLSESEWAGVVSGICAFAGALFANYLVWHFEREKKKDCAVYMAYRVAHSLEKFVIECESESIDYEAFGNTSDPPTSFPVLAYPADADGWRALGKQGAPALDFLLELERAKVIGRAPYYLSQHEMSAQCEEDRVKYADKAKGIASTFRKKYGLPNTGA